MERATTILGLATLVALLWCGCATNTIESRKQERATGYAALAPETRSLVDQGQIKVGMTMDAVYIAWGKPAQILSGETAAGTTVTWIYAGTTMQEYRVWNYRYGPYGHRYRMEPYLDYDYVARPYTRAEVVFENGVVKSWRTLAPQP